MQVALQFWRVPSSDGESLYLKKYGPWVLVRTSSKPVWQHVVNRKRGPLCWD